MSIVLELLVGDHHVAIGRDLVALDDVLVGHLFVGRRVDALLPDARTGLVGELVEADGLGRGRGVQLDGHVDESEADRA
jgi:hypothetical protein